MDTESAWFWIRVIVPGISFLPFSFLIYSFWKSRTHFLIAPRFPKMTIAASILMYIASTETLIGQHILEMYNYDRAKAVSSSITYPLVSISGNIFVFIFCSFIIFRALLIYDRWCISQYALNNQSTIMSPKNQIDINQITNTSTSHGSFHVFLRRPLLRNVAILLIILFITVCISVPSIPYQQFTILRTIFTIPWIIFIILSIFILIKSRKAKDSLLCLRETYSICSIILLQMINVRLVFIEFRIRHFIGYVLGMYR